MDRRAARRAALALTLTACGGGSPPPARDALAVADAPAAGPLLTEHGIVPVRAGMTVAEARAALDGDLSAEAGFAGDTDPDACRYASSDRVPGLIMIEGGRVVRVDADSTVATAAGVRLGEREARVRALYPTARVLPHHYVDGHYLVVLPGAPADTLHRIVFETDGQRVTAMRGGVFPPVEYMEGCS